MIITIYTMIYYLWRPLGLWSIRSFVCMHSFWLLPRLLSLLPYAGKEYTSIFLKSCRKLDCRLMLDPDSRALPDGVWEMTYLQLSSLTCTWIPQLSLPVDLWCQSVLATLCLCYSWAFKHDWIRSYYACHPATFICGTCHVANVLGDQKKSLSHQC